MHTERQRTTLSRATATLQTPAAADSQAIKTTDSSVSETTHTAATDASIALAFVDNLHALFRAMSVLPGAEVEVSATLSRHCAAPFNPMFKGVWAAELDAEIADDAITESIDWFTTRRAPFFFWWVDSRSQPVDLPPRLAAHGFVPWEVNAPGMAAPLAALRYDLMKRTPAALQIERVEDETGLMPFKDALVQGMEVPEWAGQAWVDATLVAGIEAAPWQCYVGYLDNAPVASSILFCGAGVASVFGVATVPAARGQGIGAAITLRTYQDAWERGYQDGVLFATEMGLPVYERIGFRTTGEGISRYLWRAEYKQEASQRGSPLDEL